MTTGWVSVATTTRTATPVPGAVGAPARSAKQSLARFMYCVLLADALAIAFSIWLACQVRGHWGVWGEGIEGVGLPHLCLTHGPWMALAWLAWLAARGSYSRKLFAAGGEEFSRVFVASPVSYTHLTLPTIYSV